MLEGDRLAGLGLQVEVLETKEHGLVGLRGFQEVDGTSVVDGVQGGEFGVGLLDELELLKVSQVVELLL